MKTLLLKILKVMLKKLAVATIARYRPGIVGITGNVGKTSTKEAVKAVLGSDRRVRAASKNFNNEIGLPLVITGEWQETHGIFFWLRVIAQGLTQLLITNRRYPELLILEYGVDRPGDMKYLLEIARPSIGIVTAVSDTPVHIEFFSGREAVAKEKAKLVQQLGATGFAILNADDPDVSAMREETRAHAVTFGFSESANLRILNFEDTLEGNRAFATFKFEHGGNVIPVRLEGTLGKTQAYAAAAAAATGLIFGMNLVKIAEALRMYEPPNGRLKLLCGVKEILIIDDTYNASPLSMREALETMRRLKAPRKIAVLGDMLELGKHTMEAHEAIGRLVAKVADVLITVGGRAKFIAESAAGVGFSKTSTFQFMNVQEAGAFLEKQLCKGDLILVKGSQEVRMEKIVKEIMAEPEKAEKLLVRQSKRWLEKPGLYD